MDDLLSSIFSKAVELPVFNKRATIFVVEDAGSWKAIFPQVRDRFPHAQLNPGMRLPIVFGGDEAVYLRARGPAGASEFKRNVRGLLSEFDRLVIFDAQSIGCLHEHPECINDLLQPGKAATFFYRESANQKLVQHLKKMDVLHGLERVNHASISFLAMELARSIVIEAVAKLNDDLIDEDKAALYEIRDAVIDVVPLEIEDHFLEGNAGAGVPKLRDLAHRKVVSAVLRAITPGYSFKSGIDPVDFFNERLRKKFELYGLPPAYVGEVAPNLSYAIKSQRRFSELKLD